MNNSLVKRIDKITIALYIILAGIGWLHIYSTTVTEVQASPFDLAFPYGKQLLFIGIGAILAIVVLLIHEKIYERFSSVFYLGCLALLAGLFVFGKTISGATSWYVIGSFGLQPSELAKVAISLALAKYVSDIQTDIRSPRHQVLSIVIISIPALLVLLQPDPGSALTYCILFFVLYREGLPFIYILIPLIAIFLFIVTLLFGALWIGAALMAVMIVYVLFKKRKKQKIAYAPVLALTSVAVIFSFSVATVFSHVLEQRHRDRLSLWLRLEKDPAKIENIKRTIGYNTHQSEIAVSSGGWLGKGFLEGTLTKGDFVPEQHTDYIFSSVAEEWGFVGSLVVVALFTFFLLRLLFLAERQKSGFGRIYGYSMVAIFFIHFFVNIGMVIGLLPTVGIPLPFFSYGGSGFLSFTLLLFIFLKLDATKYINA